LDSAAPWLRCGSRDFLLPLGWAHEPAALQAGSRARLRLHHPSDGTVALLLWGGAAVDAWDGQHPFRSAREPSCCAMPPMTPDLVRRDGAVGFRVGAVGHRVGIVELWAATLRVRQQ